MKNPIMQLNCDVIEIKRYEATEDQHIAAMESLRNNKLVMTDGRIHWTNPDTGALEPADASYMLRHYGVGYAPKFGVGSDAAPETGRKTSKAEAKVTAKMPDANTKKDEETLKKYREQHEHNMEKDRGEPFVFVHINSGAVQNGSPLVNIAPAALSRLAVLACHISYGDNVLMIACRGGTRRMTQRDIKKCLNLPRATFNRFWDSVHAEAPADGKYIIGNDETGYRLTVYAEKRTNNVKNEDGKIETESQLVSLFRYGQLDRGRSQAVQKMYINVLQNLYYGGQVQQPDGSYRAIAPTDHRAIGRILLLLPYLHEEENALCWNPHEKNVDRIQPLNSVDVAKILGVDIDHVSREIKRMLDFTVDVEVEKAQKTMHLFSRHETGSKTVYFVNPALVYFGSAENYRIKIRSEWLYVKNEKVVEVD